MSVGLSRRRLIIGSASLLAMPALVKAGSIMPVSARFIPKFHRIAAVCGESASVIAILDIELTAPSAPELKAIAKSMLASSDAFRARQLRDDETPVFSGINPWFRSEENTGWRFMVEDLRVK